METIIKYIEIFALISGLFYIYLEIRQKEAMWILGIFTSLASVVSFAYQHLFASMSLNIYYVAMSVFGLIQWHKASKQMSEEKGGDGIHLARISVREIIVSAILMLAGTVILFFVLQRFESSGSNTLLDVVALVMSAIATWWLAKSYIHHWFLWIVADLISSLLCFANGMHWLGLLYLMYSLSAIYGYVHWKRKGEYLVSD